MNINYNERLVDMVLAAKSLGWKTVDGSAGGDQDNYGGMAFVEVMLPPATIGRHKFKNIWVIALARNRDMKVVMIDRSGRHPHCNCKCCPMCVDSTSLGHMAKYGAMVQMLLSAAMKAATYTAGADFSPGINGLALCNVCGDDAIKNKCYLCGESYCASHCFMCESCLFPICSKCHEKNKDYECWCYKKEITQNYVPVKTIPLEMARINARTMSYIPKPRSKGRRCKSTVWWEYYLHCF